MRTPTQSIDIIAEWGTTYLGQVIAIDSQSDEKSETIPSTQGQRHLSDVLRAFFEGLGYAATQDDYANLIVTVDSNLGEADVPAVAFMVHMDTSEGTEAVAQMETAPAWDGSRVVYPANERLTVSAERYPATRFFVGEDLLHGPGAAPIGLDDKLGMSELMTLARILRENPDLPHGRLLLIFRPDEEIGRMAAVEGLAAHLEAEGVRYGYTVDGITPFEVNVENFNAARALVSVPSGPVEAVGRRVDVRIHGVKSHGATAKAEGYLNATLVLARAMAHLSDVAQPVGFASDSLAETSADAAFLVADAAGEAALLAALRAELEPHAWRGAELIEVASGAPNGSERAGLDRVVRHLLTFLETPGVHPRLSEESDGHQGYSNPYFLSETDGHWQLHYRLRDFSPDGLTGRKDHVVRVCQASGLNADAAQIDDQYVNMGPDMAAFPELVEWAVKAMEPLGQTAITDPIRGGTGVDPFLSRGIPVANLGTGYFAPESEKELTSRQNIARHALWLTNLVQVIASP